MLLTIIFAQHNNRLLMYSLSDLRQKMCDKFTDFEYSIVIDYRGIAGSSRDLRGMRRGIRRGTRGLWTTRDIVGPDGRRPGNGIINLPARVILNFYIGAIIEYYLCSIT